MSAVVHFFLPFFLCIALANTDIFDNVLVDMSYDHYAEQRVDQLPAFLAMPFNCLVNVGYIIVGVYWLTRRMKDPLTDYAKDVFALMALAYGPIQWTRLATLRRAPCVLDQWITLPIFAWVPVWCRYITHGWSTRYAVIVEVSSVMSYFLALLHDRGFDFALGVHIAAALLQGAASQRSFGDQVSLRYLILAALSCVGFVLLKILDYELAKFWLFQKLTGHFWSKVCDILQFHYSFCFLTHLTQIAHKRTS
ncbi:transmembrane protein 187 [Tachysurus fulvidraco]|uniref:transmembrane protein 187 n=1 Tax=Tachysurus fulvidraco TaxID=1234273 RepID=UPI000F4F55E4|nr:transmembrane protein 187 [Tachysurus fulvidraco]